MFLSFHHFLGEKHRGPISLSIVNIILYPTSLKRKNHNWMWMDAGSCAKFRNVNCNAMWPWLCKIQKVQFTKCFHRETNERFHSRGTFLYKMRNIEPWDCRTAVLFNLLTTDYLGFLKNISLELRPKVRLSNLVPFNAPSSSEKKVIGVILL